MAPSADRIVEFLVDFVLTILFRDSATIIGRPLSIYIYIYIYPPPRLRDWSAKCVSFLSVFFLFLHVGAR